ncbi:UBX domain-containing protein 4 [Ischnura elegans]|uniref:UBX domain-containing protein 4 n=1 Tax=Ischnura elegans TaxID=197161 RepID=UPI001ED88412|nr:UBX domain-containing protein 4 [Ischnura elegans]
MNWFQGSIGEAIVASKSKQALFVVFIAGDDGASKSTTAAIESREVSSKLGSDDFVAIRLESGSEPYRQFVQIYQLVPIPSLFFIGKNGEPVEILAGERSASQLCGHIDKVLEKCGKRAPATDAAASSSEGVASKAESATTEAVPEIVPVSSAPVNSEKAPEIEKSPAVVAPPVTEQSLGSTSTATVEVKAEGSSEVEMQDDKVPEKETDKKKESGEGVPVKVDHAKELIAQRRQEREAEEQAKELEREEMRRRSGKETARFRREQEERNILAAQKEREREKAEEKAARERILKQIAMDRAEQSARYEAEKNAAKKRKLEEDQRRAAEEQERASQLAAARSNSARIQFRLPDGTSHTHQFDAGATLGDVRSYVKSNVTLPFRNFTMSLAFPRREFTADEDVKTLRELELAPSAAVLILPVMTTEITSAGPGGGGLSAFIWRIISPFMFIFSFLRGLVFGSSDRRDDQSQQSGGRREDADRKSHSGSASISSPPPSMHGAIRRRGSGMSLAGGSVGTGGGIGIGGGSLSGSLGTSTDMPSRMRREGNVHRLPTGHDGDSDDDNNTWNGNSTQQM